MVQNTATVIEREKKAKPIHSLILGDRAQKNPSEKVHSCWLPSYKLGLDNQLTLIKLPLTELWAMIFHIKFGSVVSWLRPLGIKLWSDCISNPKACLTLGRLNQYRHPTWFALKQCSQCTGSGWPFWDTMSLACVGHTHWLVTAQVQEGMKGECIQAKQKARTRCVAVFPLLLSFAWIADNLPLAWIFSDFCSCAF